MNGANAAVRWRWPTVGRVIVAVLLALAAFGPEVPWRAPAVDVIVLVDASDSMPPTADTWPVIARRLAAMPSGSRWMLLRYGAEPVLESDWADVSTLSPAGDMPRRALIDATASRLDLALEAGLRRVDANRPTAVLILTDGGGTRPGVERLLGSAQRASLPIHVVPVQPNGLTTARIDAVITPDLARPDSPAKVGVDIEGTVPDGATVSLLLGNARVAGPNIAATGAQTLWFEIPAPPVGVHRLEAVLGDPDGSVLDSADGVLHVAGAPRVLLIGDGDSQVRNVLERAGLTVTQVSPGRLAGATAYPPGSGATQVSGFGLIVLDDVAATRLDAAATTRLAAAVRRDGAALLALGGAGSFGAGAYRHSPLEDLLPVIAEAREPLPSAAIVFVVDASGSMARSDTGPTRLALARRAVLDTARGLAAGDAVGFVSFDVQPAIALPLEPRADHVAALEARWPAGAGGGTRVAPAIAIATQMLAATESEQRLLVLVTDGFVEEDFDEQLIANLRRTGIDVIAMPVGTDPPLAPLARLAGVNGGRLLPVAEAAALPGVMQTEVAARRAPSVRRPAMAVTAAGDGWVPGPAPWPDVNGYMVTRPRADARVLLRSPAADPVLAVMPLGSGLTAAMPAGLGHAWAGDWLRWPGLDNFVADLAGWLAGQPAQTGIHVRFDEISTPTRIHIDVLGNDGQWRNDVVPDVSVRGPQGRASRVAVTLTGPGTYEAPMPSSREGLYVATVRTAGQSLVRGHVHRPLGEYDDTREGTGRLAAWQTNGRVRDTSAWRFSQPADPTGAPVRPALLLAALLLYVAVLVVERRGTLFPGPGNKRGIATPQPTTAQDTR